MKMKMLENASNMDLQPMAKKALNDLKLLELNLIEINNINRKGYVEYREIINSKLYHACCVFFCYFM